MLVAKKPQVAVVRTSRFLEAWVLPRWVPIRLRDRVIAKKLGLFSRCTCLALL